MTADLFLRAATEQDRDFVRLVTELSMRAYAEQSWGYWDGRAQFDLAHDRIVQLAGTDIGVIGLEPCPDHWRLRKFYLLPDYRNAGLGHRLMLGILADADAHRLPVRLTVLEVNPARAFYERHGFRLTHTVPPRHHMERPFGSQIA
jgi:GNAT superfamily N-acetyltransferase